MTFFTPKADKIVGTDCSSLLKVLNNPGPRDIPETIHAITGKTHIFQFHYNTSSKLGPPEFIFDKVLDEPPTTKQIADKPSGNKLIIVTVSS